MLDRAARLGRCLPRRIISGDVLVNAFRLYAATGTTVARLDGVDGTSVQSTIVLGNEHQSREGHIVNGVMSVAVDPHDSERIYADTFDRGIYRSR